MSPCAHVCEHTRCTCARPRPRRERRQTDRQGAASVNAESCPPWVPAPCPTFCPPCHPLSSQCSVLLSHSGCPEAAIGQCVPRPCGHHAWAWKPAGRQAGRHGALGLGVLLEAKAYRKEHSPAEAVANGLVVAQICPGTPTLHGPLGGRQPPMFVCSLATGPVTRGECQLPRSLTTRQCQTLFLLAVVSCALHSSHRLKVF